MKRTRGFKSLKPLQLVSGVGLKLINKMASNKLKLTDLKVTALRAELEERDLETSGMKSILQQRLREALLQDGRDPENYVFESELSKALEENSRNSESKLDEN